jgi:hypothetical protein
VRSFADALAEPGEPIDAGPEPGLGLDPGSAAEPDPDLQLEDPKLELDPAPAAAAPADVEDPADRSITLARFGHAKLVEARPSALDDDGLRLVLEGGREARVPFARIQAIAVAVISDLGPKPVLVIDLIANWNASEGEALRGVRLRSDRFDPRPLVGDARGDATRAYVELVGRLLEATRAQPLPSIEGALGRPHACFESEAAYAQAVLDVAG